MAENERTPDCENGAALKEAVCIDAMRITIPVQIKTA